MALVDWLVTSKFLNSKPVVIAWLIFLILFLIFVSIFVVPGLGNLLLALSGLTVLFYMFMYTVRCVFHVNKWVNKWLEERMK